ncbi:hypothetical protein Tco_1004540 [Tanacetum coccineum]|uniref:Reverse transcriptase domain-containing protein n=1 Tax=Tanacetum coccineum TaxID=301880 RepID=A0ABQ5FCN8_9ASTR
MPATRSRMTPGSIEEVIAQRVVETLETCEANQNVKNVVENEGDNGNGGGNGNGNGGGNGNVNVNNNNGNGNHGDNAGGAMQAAWECTYKEFLNCQPLNFKGTERAVGLARWFEKMESVFYISNCTPRYQRTVGTDAAYAMTWKELMRLMTEVYCPRNEGPPDSIQGNATSFAPTRFQDAVRMESSLMDQKIHANTARQADNKRK